MSESNEELKVMQVSLRDYFAAKAMQGMFSQDGMTLDIDGYYMGEKRAKTAYAIADAMLKARENQK